MIMNTYLTYGIIFVILLVLELCYFKVADHFNIIDKPNERSSHKSITLRGGESYSCSELGFMPHSLDYNTLGS